MKKKHLLAGIACILLSGCSTVTVPTEVSTLSNDKLCLAIGESHKQGSMSNGAVLRVEADLRYIEGSLDQKRCKGLVELGQHQVLENVPKEYFH